MPSSYPDSLPSPAVFLCPRLAIDHGHRGGVVARPRHLPRRECRVEGGDDQVARPDGADIGANRLDNADKLVAHAVANLAGLHLLVRPEVAAADAGASDPDEGVGRLNDAGVRDSLDTDVAGTIHNRCTHGETPF